MSSANGVAGSDTSGLRVPPVLASRAANDADTCGVTPEILGLARAAYLERRQRADYFGQRHFVEPAWDILLDLFVRMGERRETTVSSSCIAASVPNTTGLRHINALVQAGLARRYPNPVDSRSALLELTPEAVGMMTAYFERVRDLRSSPNDFCPPEDRRPKSWELG